MAMEALNERLEQLERRVKLLFVPLAIAILLIAVDLWKRTTTVGLVRVERLEIVDGSGRTLMVLGRNPFGQPVITIHDVNGNQRFGVSLDADGSAMVAIFDERGRIIEKMGK